MAVAAGTRPRALIAVREPGLRAGVRLALQHSVDCWEADEQRAALEFVVRESPDICLVECDVAGSALRLTELIHQAQPDVQVLLLTHSVDEAEFLDAIRAGAIGYLSGSVDPGRLPQIVEGLLRGEAAIPRVLVRSLVDELRGGGRRRIQVRDRRAVNLTRREAEVLDLVREGVSTGEIARRLGISEVTVRRHRSSLLSKLDAKSTAELLGLPETEPVVGGHAAARG